MTVVVVAFLLTAFNVVMWLIFALRFKKIFSTDDILNRTRTELNEMLNDINRNADRNITLIDERLRQLKAVSAEADRHLEILKKELAKVESTQAFQEKLAAVTKPQNSLHKKNRVTSTPASTQGASISGRYTQGDLFITKKVQEELSKDRVKEKTDVPSAQQQEEHSERIRLIPIVEPEIFATEKMTEVQVKKDFKTQVRELYNLGETPENIAVMLGRSVPEVKFSLEFS